MSLPRVEHELHNRRKSRNVGLGLVLGSFVLLVMGMTYVKLTAQNAAAAAAFEAKQAAEQASQTGASD
ncbi:cytochrome C oxidase assembly protein [Lentibacter algarum]|uniref:cytochrome C oxidase assembly protein n=1 Tax=Lentibacter algarum TaxID=576131 RepID=UPI002091A791|nr:cytochrome C oxidase assembly protein [Lentibacter algarum]